MRLIENIKQEVGATVCDGHSWSGSKVTFTADMGEASWINTNNVTDWRMQLVAVQARFQEIRDFPLVSYSGRRIDGRWSMSATFELVWR